MMPLSAWLQLFGGLIYAALGTFLLVRRGSSPASRILGVYLASYAAIALAIVLREGLLLSGEPDTATILTFDSIFLPAFSAAAVLGAAALIALVVRFPRPLGPGYQGTLWFATGVAIVELVFLTASQGGEEFDERISVAPVPIALLYRLVLVAFPASMASSTWALIVLAARFRREGGAEGPHARDHVLFTIAVLFSLAWKGVGVLGQPTFRPWFVILFTALVTVTIAGLWLWNAATERGSGSRVSRNLGWLALVMTLAGMVIVVFVGPNFTWVIFGFAAAFVAYAVLRHQFLGIDLKVRWGISKGTVAALFVATFFVVSELAKVFFEGLVNNVVVGILAAGLLVFAIAPLQRFANRIADKAVPIGAPSSIDAASDPKLRESAYRAAVRMAWSDGDLSEQDEDALAELADSLALPSRRARALLREVSTKLQDQYAEGST